MTKTLTAALLALTALSPSLVSAQAGTALGSPDGTVEIPEAPSRVVLDPEIVEMRAGRARAYQAPAYQAPPTRLIPQLPREDTEPSDGPSFGASIGHAAAGFGIGIGAGGLLGGGLTLAVTCQDSDGFCVLYGLMGAGLGAATLSPFGAALGAWGFGERRGGTGNFFAALGGAYLGAGLGVVAGTLISMAELGYGMVFGPILGALLTTLGAAAGYQLSSHGPRERSESASTGPTFAPSLETVRGGATVGIAGAF